MAGKELPTTAMSRSWYCPPLLGSLGGAGDRSTGVVDPLVFVCKDVSGGAVPVVDAGVGGMASRDGRDTAREGGLVGTMEPTRVPLRIAIGIRGKLGARGNSLPRLLFVGASLCRSTELRVGRRWDFS